METQSHTGNILDIFCLHQLCCLCTLSTIFRMHSAHALKGLQEDTSYSSIAASAQLAQISALEKCISRDRTCWSAFTFAAMPSSEAHGRHAQPVLLLLRSLTEENCNCCPRRSTEHWRADNMKTAKNKSSTSDEICRITPLFHEMCTHLPRLCMCIYRWICSQVYALC